MENKKKSKSPLFWVLLVLGVIILCVAVVVVLTFGLMMINPGQQLADTRNGQRKSDTNMILEGISLYAIDTGRNLPGTIPTSTGCGTSPAQEICRTDATDCSGLVDLSVLTDDYLLGIPTDPISVDTNGSGYYISQNTEGEITVCAPNAENEAEISFTR